MGMENWPSQSRKETSEEAAQAEASLSNAQRKGSTEREGFLAEAITYGTKAGLSEAEVTEIVRALQFGHGLKEDTYGHLRQPGTLTFPLRGHEITILRSSRDSRLPDALLARELVSIDDVDADYLSDSETLKKFVSKFREFFSVLQDIQYSDEETTREVRDEIYAEAEKRGDKDFRMPNKASDDYRAKIGAAEGFLAQLAA